jgi:phosphoribosyl 1,2-cyclic phosphate phosphodiesterase
MWNCKLERPDVVLVTHEHGDHFLGLDDLLVFRRSVPKDAWRPIPVYATEQAWKTIEARFGYLIGSLIERRFAVPGAPLEGLQARVTPFKTFHGPTAAGSVGYVVEETRSNGDTFKLVYTSDFVSLPDEPAMLMEPDVLVTQAHWLNEPAFNRPSLMSFQNALEYIKRWRPKRATFLVHISAGDMVPDDPCNNSLKKLEPLSPLKDLGSGKPYPIPRCQSEWEAVVDRITQDHGVSGPVVVAYDGQRCEFD